MTRKLSIAVVGDIESGKTYLLYDLIHAFHVLGYAPRQLPLDYAHSSFGKFFYDTIDVTTGGMLKTDVVASRPESHYGAHLADSSGNSIEVDFLNIPGEVFGDQGRIRDFFSLKRCIEHNRKGVFWLAEYRSPSRHVIRLAVPRHDFEPIVGTSGKVSDYRSWDEIAQLLKAGTYQRVSCREVSGAELLRRLHTVMTDSVLLTIKENWKWLVGAGYGYDVTDFEERLVRCFYPLVYCQNATDLIVCDSLFRGCHTGVLSDCIKQYFSNEFSDRAHNVYLAYRDADRVLARQLEQCRGGLSAEPHPVLRRNRAYALCVEDIFKAMNGNGGCLPPEVKEHIRLSASRGAGRDFWHLLNQSRPNGKRLGDHTAVLPPHVYFTATPIDDGFNVYANDTDVTRFVCRRGDRTLSFVRENCADMSRHGCFGSLQLLIDILARNRALPRHHRQQLPDILKYFFEM